MAKKRRNRKVIPFQHERTLTYNKAKPNRQARRLGIKPEEPKREEKKTVSKAAVLSQKAKQAKKNHTAGNDIRRIYGISERQKAAVGREEKEHTGMILI